METEEIDKLFQEGKPPKLRDFRKHGAEEDRNEILKDIKASGFSLTKFAEECDMTVSHLYDFLNGKKRLNRDKVLVICLELGYDYTRVCKLLRHLELPQLYPKEERDYLIMLGIEEKKTVQEIDDLLEEKKLATLCS